MENTLTFDDVVKNIRNALDSIDDGEMIADIHNELCATKIKYDEDSIWEYTGESD